MQREWTDEELKEIASQLGNPTGESGIKTGEMMSLSNNGMISATVALLNIEDGHRILEIGPGNGKHVGQIMIQHENLLYTGLDISETMILEATQHNSVGVMQGKINFVLSNGKTIPFSANTFDSIFTVNTIYFWEDAQAYASEILRVLKPGGMFNLSLADKSFMEKLPFTRYGFKLYNKPEAKKLMQSAGFEVVDIIEQIDITVGRLGQPIERDMMVLTCRKRS